MATKTWLVTGCSTGFGRALAQLLLERGERVALGQLHARLLPLIARWQNDPLLGDSATMTKSKTWTVR